MCRMAVQLTAKAVNNSLRADRGTPLPELVRDELGSDAHHFKSFEDLKENRSVLSKRLSRRPSIDLPPPVLDEKSNSNTCFHSVADDDQRSNASAEESVINIDGQSSPPHKRY